MWAPLSHWREVSRAELPEVSQSDARRLVVSLGLFWACFAVAAPTLEDGIGVVGFAVGLAAGWFFYLTLFRIWGAQFFLWPGRGYSERYRRSTAATASLLRPTFVKKTFRATGWPPLAVGCVLVTLLVAAMAAPIVLAAAGG
jgi:hypothetical protein